MKRFEVLWYEHHDEENYYEISNTREFSTLQAAMNFYNKICGDENKYGFWVTKRNKNWEVIEDYVV